MLSPQLKLPLHAKLVIDLFAGGGGASCGIEQAIGRCVDIAINHDPQAIGMHAANHPQTRHLLSDVWEVDPLEATQGRPVGLLHASPDCTHHSQALGGQPRCRSIRSLAWVVHRWAGKVRPEVITLENVEHASAQLRRRRQDRVLARALAVADAGEHITQGIGQCHLLTLTSSTW